MQNDRSIKEHPLRAWLFDRLINRHGSGDSVSSPDSAIVSWINEIKAEGLPPVRGHIALLAGRNFTWVEWTVYAAVWMRKLGYAPFILFSGEEIRRIYRGKPSFRRLGSLLTYARNCLGARDFWSKVAGIPDVLVIDIDREQPADPVPEQHYAEFAAAWAHTTAAYDLRVEEHEEGPLKGEYEATRKEHQARLIKTARIAESILRRLADRHSVRRLVSYSGLVGVTPAFGEAARRLGWQVVFVETWGVKPGIMICNQDLPALDWDQHLFLKTIDDWNDGRRKQIETFLKFQETNDVSDMEWLRGHLQYQRSSAEEVPDSKLRRFLSDERPVFLMAPNVIADSGTMRRRLIFGSQREWIEKTCAFFRMHPEFKLVVRAHPAEYLLRKRVRIKTGAIAEQAAAGASNIFIVYGNDKMSTYSLLPWLRAVLVWISNVGADLVARNCPAISVARAKYQGMKIAHEPGSENAYFDLITKLAALKPNTTAEQKELAKQFLSILYFQKSFHAFGPDFSASDVRLSNQPHQADFDLFYRIIAGDLPVETRPASWSLSAGTRTQ